MERPLRADDEARTRDLNLGKVALYQLSYVRLLPQGCPWRTTETVAHAPDPAKSGSTPRFVAANEGCRDT